MFYSNRRDTADQYSIRTLPLLEGEQIEERFVPYDGLVPNEPSKGELLVLTNQRVISFLDNDGHRETFLAPLEELNGVSVRANTRGLKHLSQGLILMLVGILAYFTIGYILDGVTIAAALGAAIAFVGVLFIARYFFWEEEGTITFQGGNWELTFPYKSNLAGAMVYKLVNRFFQLKQATNAHQPPPEDGAREVPPEPPASTASDDPFYYI